ncbi:tyrosine-type recombinase/integrase [Novosphingobium sp. KACC 22771]|uniref:tyrosine-type recombinase/integrase n=1 Tax=Novosphingobium sp. KACC 22771 TaxID=3025670 RepID=UPI002366025E|nr:integrase arm-type DNA-binding domain-containing protein [Novosphingobium sp. KACC 22771]WDF72257.1 tyrosine-type recombinase/integrase [Novosphingobium sp. KACC 22771]
MALTETAVRNAKPKDKAYKLSDSGGLYLFVTPAGGKLWRMKFRVSGKEKLLSFGGWPQVKLAMARKERDKAKESLASGTDPAREKQKIKLRAKVSAANTFGEIAQEFINKRRREGMSESTADKSEYYISRMGSQIARMPVSEITAPDLLAVLRRIETKGNYETSRRVLQLAGRVFRYAIATARLVSDPSRDLRGALTAPRSKHYGAITDPKAAGELLRAIETYEGMGITKIAMRLSAYVFVRPGELRHAEWADIDLDAGLWTIPAEKMKMRKAHHIPLSRQSVEVFQELMPLTGPTGYVFPSIRTRKRPMSENTVNAGLRRLGYTGDEMTAHGFRAMASTLLNESGKWSADAIERALAHGDSDKVRAAYHRGTHWKERVEMAQWWSDYLDALRDGAAILPFPEQKHG